MNNLIMILPANGIQGSETLNRLAEQSRVNPEFKGLTFHFEMGFDGIYELIIKPRAKSRTCALVIKERANKFHCFTYRSGFDAGNLHDGAFTIESKKLASLVSRFFKTV
jgi:hypothetical protein